MVRIDPLFCNISDIGDIVSLTKKRLSLKLFKRYVQ